MTFFAWISDGWYNTALERQGLKRYNTDLAWQRLERYIADLRRQRLKRYTTDLANKGNEYVGFRPPKFYAAKLNQEVI